MPQKRRIQALAFSLALACTTCSASALQDASPQSEGKDSSKAPPADIPVLPLTPQTPETLKKERRLEEEADSHLQKGEYDRAIGKLQEAYGLSVEMKYGDGEGRALTKMCTLYLKRGQTSKAKQLGEHAIATLENSSDKKARAQAHVALAQVYFAMDVLMLAARQLDAAATLLQNCENVDAAEAAQVALLSVHACMKYGQVKEAMSFYRYAAGLYKQAGDSLKSFHTLMNLFFLELESGLYAAAKEDAEKLLHDAQAGKDPGLIASAWGAVALGQYNLCEYSAAKTSYETALKYLKQAPDDFARAKLQFGYGVVLSAVGDYDQAQSQLELALPQIKAKARPFNHAELVNALGCVEFAQGRYQEAKNHFLEALDLQSVLRPASERMQVILLQNLAASEIHLGGSRSAKGRLEGALALFGKLKDPLLEGMTYAALGEICLNLKDVQAAERYLRKGIEISQKVSDDASLWRDFTNLARIQYAQQQSELVTDSLNSALSFFRSPQAGAMPTPERLTYPSAREALGQQLVSLLVTMHMVEPALLVAEQLKEESFINEWHRRGGQVKLSDKEIYQDLVTTRAHLRAAEASVTPNFLVKEWQNWMHRFRQLCAENRSLARLISPVPATVTDIIKGARASHATIIDYLVGEHNTVVFTIDAAGVLSATKLPVGREELQPQVTQLLALSSRADAQPASERRALQQLYSQLMPEEVRKTLPANPDQTVVVIPDGILFNLPFAALLDEDGKYLIEKNTLTLASSLGVFLDSPPRYTDNLSVVVADTDANAASSIASLFEPDVVTTLLGTEAALPNLQDKARGKSVLHFPATIQIPASDPLHSVLPFTADNGLGNVTADKLFGSNLSSDLAVWSNTAVNSKDLNGTGVKIFSRGLNYAGVRNVLMTLWAVPASARSTEIGEFYKSKQRGLNPAQSLRHAQLLAISRDASLRSWAAFQLLGPGY